MPESSLAVGLRFTTRRSDSPSADAVGTGTSEQVTAMTSVAGVGWGLVFWEQAGRTHAGIHRSRDPDGTAPVPEGATFTGIEFAVGTSLRAVPRRRRPTVASASPIPPGQGLHCRG